MAESGIRIHGIFNSKQAFQVGANFLTQQNQYYIAPKRTFNDFLTAKISVQ